MVRIFECSIRLWDRREAAVWLDQGGAERAPARPVVIGLAVAASGGMTVATDREIGQVIANPRRGMRLHAASLSTFKNPYVAPRLEVTGGLTYAAKHQCKKRRAALTLRGTLAALVLGAEWTASFDPTDNAASDLVRDRAASTWSQKSYSRS